MPENITIVSQGEYVARSLTDYLRRHPEINNKCTKEGKCLFLTTEAESKFSESALTFLNRQIEVKHISIENSITHLNQ